jgi:hypothetical protein
MRKRFILMVTLGLILVLTALAEHKRPKMPFELTAEESTLLEKADAVQHKENAKHNKDGTDTLITFSISPDKSDEAWKRVQAFLTNYGPGLDTVADFEISTLTNSFKRHFGYLVRRMPVGANVEFTALCTFDGNLKKETAFCAQNVHLLALYALTGELIDRMIAR